METPVILGEIKSKSLTIDKLCDTISPVPNATTNGRDSDASDAVISTYPATFAAELQHYKEVFSRLHLIYTEQVTKQQFLSDILEDPAVIREDDEIERKEAETAVAKQKLNERKDSIQKLLDNLEETSRRIMPKYQQIHQEAELSQKLPKEIIEMEAQTGRAVKDKDWGSDLNLPLSDTVDKLATVQAELNEMEKELQGIIVQLPKKKQLLQRLDQEVSMNESNKQGLEEFASEAVRAREGARAAGKAGRENAGQWYKSSYQIVTGLLDGD